MPPAIPIRTAPPRTLAHILLDLGHARRDWLDATTAAERGDEEADDRAHEADQRVDALRMEFETGFQQATGLTFGQLQSAIQEALL